MSTTKKKVLEILSAKAPCVVLEIGAHVGGDTLDLWSAAGGVNCPFYLSVEPDPRNAEEFRVNHDDILLIQAAVSNRNGLSPYRGSFPYTGSGSIKEPRKHLERWPEVKFPDEFKTVVPTITLDEIVDTFGLTRIDLIWCDVQGAEDLVIAGGQRALAMTRWFHTEFYDNEIYQGQMPLAEIMKHLPGEWEQVETYLEDVLLRNKAFDH